MAADNVAELIIRLTGDKEALKSLESIQSAKEQLSKQKIQAEFDRNSWREMAHDIKGIMDDLKKELSKELIDKDSYKDQMQYWGQMKTEATNMANVYSDSIAQINNAMHGLTDAENDFIAKEDEKARAAEEAAQRQAAAAEEAAQKEAAAAEEAARREQEAAEAAARAEEDWNNRIAASEAEKQRQIEETIAAYDRMADAIHTVAEGLSSVSSLSSGVADFAEGISGAFGQMAGLFKSDIFDTIEKTLTVLATKAFTADMGKVTGRYDIMNTFTDYMELTGVSADEANEALKRVNDSILGLPIGLDESAQRLRRYQMFMDDLTAATDLTIGVQHAITAGGANAQMKNMAYTQIDRLLAAGKLNTARQWLSLIQGLGVSMRFVTEAMGVTGMSVNELADGLTSGDISAKEFLNALQELGRGGTSASAGLEKALEIYKGTIESWLSNIQFATIRGGETILKSVNQMLQDVSGEGIVDYMKRYRDFLNSMYKGIGNFITSNPAQFGAAIDQIERILDLLQRFDFNDIAGQGLNNMLTVGRGIETFLKALPVEDTGKFIAFATTLAGPVRKAMSAFSSGLPVVLGIFNRFKNFDFEILFDKMLRLADVVARVVETVLRLIPDSMMTDLLAFGLVLGRPLASAIDGLVGGLGALEKVVRWAAPGRLADSGLFKTIMWLVQNHQGVLLAAGAVTALATALGAAAYIRYQRGNKVADLLGTDNYEATIRKTNQLTESIIRQKDEWRKNSIEASHSADGLEELLTKIANLDTRIHATPMMDRDSLISQQLDYISQANELYGFNMALDQSTGLLDENSRALADNAEKVAEYVVKVAEAKAAQENLEEISRQRMSADVERQIQFDEMLSLQREAYEARSAYNRQHQANRVAMAQGGEGADYEAENLLEQRMYDAEELAQSAKDALKPLDEQIEELNKKYAIYTQQATDAAQATESIKKSTEGLADAFKGTAQELDESGFTDMVQNLTKTYNELVEDATKSMEKSYGFGEVDEVKTEALAKTTENINAQADAYEKFIENMDKLQEYLETHHLDQSIMSAFGEIAGTGMEGAGIIQGLVDQIDAGNDDAVKALGEAYARRATAFSEAAKEQAATQLLSGMKDIVNLALSKSEDEDLFGGALDDAFVKSFTLNDEQIEAASQQVDETVAMVVEKTQALGDAVTPLAEALSGGETSGESGEEVASLVSAIKNTQQHIGSLVEESIPTMMDAISDLMEQVTTFTDETLENLRVKFNDTKKAAEQLKQEINRLASVMESKGSTIDSFAGHFDTLVEKVNAATEAVNALQSAINSLEGKSIDVGASVGGEAIRRASGGFVPHGTDTVPAMLTPGEFVLRRSAAQKIGAPVLNMLNNMNIPHAIDALMSRVAKPMAHSFVNYDNRRTYDNHATVNQTIYTDNPSFTYRRASRFAHAL